MKYIGYSVVQKAVDCSLADGTTLFFYAQPHAEEIGR